MTVAADIFVLCLPICCGTSALVCCLCGGQHIPGSYFHHRHYVYPILTPPESQIMQEAKQIVLVENPNQSEVYLGISCETK